MNLFTETLTLMRIAAACILFLLFSCNNPQAEEQHTGLYAQLHAAKTDLHSLNEAVITATIKNYGPRDTVINEFVFQNAILALEVKNDSGKAVLSIPPPVPPLGLNEYNRELHPGDSVIYRYQTNIFVLPERAGNYHVKLDGIPSDEIILQVK